MKCSYCGRHFNALRSDAVCCSTRCATAFKNLEMVRAKRIYRCLYWWRFDRKGTSTADNLRFIAREIRSWIEEDKLSQRPPPPRHAHDMDRGHQAVYIRMKGRAI